MSLAQAQVAAAATVELLIPPRSSRRALILRNHDATNAAVIGGPNVTATGATGGVQLKPGDPPFIVPNGAGASDAWYVVAAAGTPVVGIVEVF